jgi:hypothetical protein
VRSNDTEKGNIESSHSNSRPRIVVHSRKWIRDLKEIKFVSRDVASFDIRPDRSLRRFNTEEELLAHTTNCLF